MTECSGTDRDGRRLRMRVAAICIRQGRVLLQHAIDGDLWHAPGGRLLPTESSTDALVRTMRWELGQDVTVRRLLWVTGLVHPAGGRRSTRWPSTTRPNCPGTARFPVEALTDLPLLPDFLRTSLGRMPDHVEHVVRRHPAG